MSGCTACPLHETTSCVGVRPRFSSIPTEDSPRLDVVFVSDAPGPDDEARRTSLRGDEGEHLDAAISRFGITSWAMTSVVRCRPPGDKPPRAAHAKVCIAEWLTPALERWRPRVVVPLGAKALKYVAGLDKITEHAGRKLSVPGKPWAVFPILSPSAALRYPERFAQPFQAQMRALGHLLNRTELEGGIYEQVTVQGAIERFRALRALETPTPWGFDIETMPLREGFKLALNPHFNRILTAAVSTEEGKAWWFEWPEDPSAQCDELLEAILGLLGDKRHPMVAHNAMMEVKHLLHHVVTPVRGIEDARRFTWPVFDSMLDYYLLNEDAKGQYGLDKVRQVVVPMMPEYDAKVSQLVASGTPHHALALTDLGDYNAGDADATRRIHFSLWPKIEGVPGLLQVWQRILEPTIFTLAWAELAGRKIDFDAVDRLHREFVRTKRRKLRSLRRHRAVRKACRAAGLDVKKWNPGSPVQVAAVVYDTLGLEPLGTTASGKPSTKEVYLEPYARQSRFVRDYLAWKNARTLDDVYLTPYTQKAAPDGFLYGSYHQHGTATGRLASSSPNLQNLNQLLRQIVVSRYPNGLIVESDLSQIELRLMAMEAVCAVLLQAYRDGIDVHALTATKVTSRLLGREVTMKEVLAQHAEAEASGGRLASWRQDNGKRPNFALLYDAKPKRFSQEFHVSLKVATLIHAAFHDAYPEIGAYHESIRARVKEKGWISSLFGRRRRLPAAQGDWHPYTPRWWEQLAAFREAGNFPIQSFASDLNTRAATRTRRELAQSRSRILLLGMTHDSATYDVPPEDATPEGLERFRQMLHRNTVTMTHKAHPWITVPLAIDVKAGSSWGTLAKLKAFG